MIADIITASRILFSIVILFTATKSSAFLILYVLCGISDMLDGFIARMLHTESKHGAMLDSIADLIFAFAYAVKILPQFYLPHWLWLWTAVIAVFKTAEIIVKRKLIEHSLTNKLTGLFIFILPFASKIIDAKYCAVFILAISTISLAEELIQTVLK